MPQIRCQCELDHDAVGSHPAFHGTPGNPNCQNFGTEVLGSDYGTFILCPPCASDALEGDVNYYWRKEAP